MCNKITCVETENVVAALRVVKAELMFKLLKDSSVTQVLPTKIKDTLIVLLLICFTIMTMTLVIFNKRVKKLKCNQARLQLNVVRHRKKLAMEIVRQLIRLRKMQRKRASPSRGQETENLHSQELGPQQYSCV